MRRNWEEKRAIAVNETFINVYKRVGWKNAIILGLIGGCPDIRRDEVWEGDAKKGLSHRPPLNNKSQAAGFPNVWLFLFNFPSENSICWYLRVKNSDLRYFSKVMGKSY